MALLCPRCYGGSVMDEWDEAPIDAVRWMKCLECSHRFDAQPKGETMPKFKSPEHEANWRAAMAARKGKPRSSKRVEEEVEPIEPADEDELLDDPERLSEEDEESELEEETEVLSEIIPPVTTPAVRRSRAVTQTGNVLAIMDAAIAKLDTDRDTLEAARKIIERLNG